ncbi:MAG: 30S ribosomal protein S7 [Chloroflexi bacterium]|nr:30S ribosomal protein S7 [Chloroflexota bacterium]MCL5074262.1 30S ribosomal protein S7 [Chloroflexota bacterium]
MPRRARVIRRLIEPDPKYQNRMLAKFINKVMMCGKKSRAESIVYDALDLIANQQKRNPIEVFEQALKNATPLLEVKPRRVGGATYQVPVEIKGDRRLALAMRWLIQSTRARAGKTMAEKLAVELTDAAHGVGATVKKREDTHKMAEANKAFSHYRW